MKNVVLVVVLCLSLLNTTGVAWLVLDNQRSQVDYKTIEQSNKLFQLVKESQAEMEKLGSQATFPDDESRKKWKDALHVQDLLVEGTRVAHVNFMHTRTPESLAIFLGLGKVVMSAAKPALQTYDAKTFKFVPLVNVSRLEAMDEQYDFTMLQLMKELN